MVRTNYLIVGCGPGGLQLAYYLAKAGRPYVILERATHPGSFFATFPRHRILISANKVHTVSDHPERRLRFATGNSKPFIPEIPGIELAENYTQVSVDPLDFVNQPTGSHERATQIISILAEWSIAGCAGERRGCVKA
jgi:thioredoxin reductase